MTNNKKIIWKTEKRKVSDLTEYTKNPRSLSEKQKEQLAESFRRFNYVELVAINTDNTIIAGHQRIKVLKYLGRGEEEIDIRIPNRKLTKKELEEYLLRSNKNTGSWDYEMLYDFDIEVLMDIGFDEDELSEIWNDFLFIDDEKEIKKIIPKESDIVEGDMFKLGEHYLICGDSTKPEVLKKLLGDTKVDMIYTDPPYNINLDYNKGTGNKQNYGGSVKDNLNDDDYRTFLTTLLQNGLKHCNKNAHVFMYCDQRYVGLVQNIYTKLNISYQRTCLWIKNGLNPTPQVAFSKCYEPCIYGVVGEPYLSNNQTKLTEVLNKEIQNGNAGVDDISSLMDIWLADRISSIEYDHPTQKPISLHEKPLLRCTKVNDIVLDLCGGSGSTLLACEELKRKAYVVEKSPIFCQLIINLYEEMGYENAKKIN